MAAACCGESWHIMWIRINWSCGGTARCLGEYLDSTLSLRRRRAVEAHLRGCAACRWELESMRRTLALLSDLPRREVSDHFEAALRTRLAGIEASGEPAPRARFPLPALLPPSTRYLRAPWPSEVRRLAPVGALAAVAVAVAAWNMQPVSTAIGDHHPA